MVRIVGKRGKGSFESQLDEAAKGLEFMRVRLDQAGGDPKDRD